MFCCHKEYPVRKATCWKFKVPYIFFFLFTCTSILVKQCRFLLFLFEMNERIINYRIPVYYEFIVLFLSERFRRSEPYGAWRGVWNGTREANKSLQPNVLMPESPLREGSEDCLRLNVYTKCLDAPNAKASSVDRLFRAHCCGAGIFLCGCGVKYQISIGHCE
jgi:hypothetical protein